MCTCVQAARWLPSPVGADGVTLGWTRSLLQRAGLASGAAPAREDRTYSGLHVVNPGADRIDGAAITVRNGSVTRVGPSDQEDGAEFAGCFAIPGLIDMHVHSPPPLRDFFGRLQLLHGITSVRNTGDGLDVFAYRDEVEAGTRQGPRIFACGPPLDGKPTAFPFGTISLEKPDVARAFVAKLASRGADFVKVFINLTPPVLKAIREEADRHGLRVTGHVPRFNSIDDAGVTDVQHLTGMPDHASTAFSLDGAFEPWLDAWASFDPARRDHVVASSLDEKIAHTPTLVLWKGLARAHDDAGLGAPKGLPLMPAPFVDAFWKPTPFPAPYARAVGRELLQAVERALPAMVSLVGDLEDAGVRVLAGTDTINPWVVPGASLHEELETFAEAGMSAERALVCATRDAARALGRDELGRIGPGSPADFLILEKDPSRDLEHLDTLVAVVAGGRMYRTETLRAEHDFARTALSSLPFRLANPIAGKLATTVLRALPASPPRFEAAP